VVVGSRKYYFLTHKEKDNFGKLKGFSLKINNKHPIFLLIFVSNNSFNKDERFPFHFRQAIRHYAAQKPPAFSTNF